MKQSTPLRRELLFSFGLLFAGGLIFVIVGLSALLPVLRSTTQWVVFMVLLMVVDLGVLFLFGGAVLQQTVIAPIRQLGGDAQRIAEGDYHHRVRTAGSLELDQLGMSLNAMADRLIAEQELLADNVASLDRTNEELVLARDQVIHAARLASVGTLAAGIAHEVGNPLGAIIAFADVAKSRAGRSGGDTDLLDSIRHEAERIDRIVRGLLDYARPKEVEVGPSPPKLVLERVQQLLADQGRLDAVTDEWLLEEGVPDVVMEPHQLEQVLVNLVLNALDAMSGIAEPRVTVRLWADEGGVARLPFRRADDPPGINYKHRRRVSKDEGGKGIDPLFTAPFVAVLEVEDNGPGIPESDLDRIFDPFFTTKEPGKGSGLGLSICARLVEGMGGRITVSNHAEGGALFTIRLPGIPESPRDEHGSAVFDSQEQT